MTVTVVVLLKRREGMSEEDFRDYYENSHSVLARSIIPGLMRYTRNYVVRDTVSLARQIGDAPPPAFDVITELVFADESAYSEFRRSFSDPATVALIARDEAKLFDPTFMQSFIVEPAESRE
jgi:hypothetical protein